MKNILIMLGLLFLCSCQQQSRKDDEYKKLENSPDIIYRTSDDQGRSAYIGVLRDTIDSHVYYLTYMIGSKKGGVSLIHSEDCPCQKDGNN